MTKSTQSTHRLGVPGLPPVFDAMVVGGLYGLHCSSPPARAALVAHCLAHAVGMGPVAIITNGSPRRQLEHCAEVGVRGIDQALDTGALQVFRLKASSTKNIFRHGPSRLTQEAEHFNVPDEALIIFDGADDIFTLQDSFVVAEQVRVYHEWIRQRRGCGLMIFTQLATGSQYASAYTALLDHLDGVATLESGREHLSWVVNFWASPFGMVASRTLTTHIEAGGTLLVAPQMESDTLGPDSVPPT